MTVLNLRSRGAQSRAEYSIVGTPSKEYLGMLTLYAIARCKKIFPADKGFGKLITLASETFDPFNMSESLIRRLTDLLAAEKVRYFSHP